MTFNKGNLGFLCLVWCFYFLLGGTIGVTVPFFLILIGTIFYLVV
jgi:hypothetical protein